MSVPNVIHSPAHYRRHERWKDPLNAFVFWPALWVERGVVKGLFIEESVWTLGWGHYRWRWVRGQNHTPALERPIRWNDIEGPAFLTWAGQTFEGVWSKEQVQDFFKRHPRWRDLVALGHLDNHYVRILIAREMIADAPADPTQAGGLDSLKEATRP